MPDQRSVMKEFRFLDEKRVVEGLTPAEEARHARLRELIGPEMGAGSLRGGFDVDAAAARLRDSLLPAGLRNRPPPPPAEPAPEPTFEAPSPAEALASAWAEEPFGPLEPAAAGDALFDPASLDAQPADPGQDVAAEPAWDPNASYDPNAYAAGDPNAPYDPNDPNAYAAADPNAPYDPNDPNAYAAADPNAPYDPNDPNAYAADPNAAAAWDPNAPVDPNAAAAWDPNAPVDPNAAAAWDPNALLDPNAYAADPNAPVEPDAAAAWDPNAPVDPDAAAAWDPNAPVDPDAPAAWDPNALLDPSAPVDAGAAAAWDPNAALDPDVQPALDAGAPADAGAQAAWDASAAGDPYAAEGTAAAHDELPLDGASLEEAGASLLEPEETPAPAAWDQASPDAAPDALTGEAGAWDPAAALDPAAFEAAPEAGPLEAAPLAGDATEPAVGLAAGWDTSGEPEGIAAAAAEAADVSALEALGTYDAAAWDAGQPALAPMTDALGEPLAGGGAPPATADEPSETEPTAVYGEPLHADAGALPPAGWDAEPEPLSAEPAPPEALGEYDADSLSAPPVEDAGLESMLPFDPAAEAAIAPGEVPEGFGAELGEYDDTAGFSRTFADAAPADLPMDESGFQAARSVEPAAGWAPDAALEGDGFQLESGGSFDATAAAAAPEWAVPDAAPPWEGAEAAAAPAEGGGPAEGLAGSQEWSEALPEAAPAELAPDAAPEASLAAGAVEPFLEAPAEAPDLAGPAPDLDFSRPDFSADDSGETVPADVALDASAPAEPAFELPRDAPPAPDVAAALEAPAVPDADATQAAADAAVALDDDIPTIDGEEILEEIPLDDMEVVPPPVDFAPLPSLAPEAAPPPAAEIAPPARGSVAAAPASVPAPALAAAAVPVPATPATPLAARPPPAAAAPPAVAAISPPAPSASPPAPPAAPVAAVLAPPPPPGPQGAAADPACHVAGVHRVVVHTVEGQVKRGLLADASLDATSLGLAAQPGAAPELVATDKVKAIFFMLSPGEQAPAPEGKKVRVTFRDGRQVAGFSPDYREEGAGFFMIPGDTRTNTGRIWVYRAAVRQVAVS